MAPTGTPTASCRGCAPSTRVSPRSTRAAGARARRASTSSRGTPTSRSSSSCATTPERTRAAPTTSTSPTGSPTSSCGGSRPTALVALRPERGARSCPTCGVEEFDEAYRAAEGDGRFVRQVEARELYGQDDAHPGPDRQRLDDLQGRRQPDLQPDRRAGERRAPVQPVHRDHRGLQRRRDRRLQPRLGQPRRAPHRRGRRRRLAAAARDGPDRRDLPRPGDRHQLLPEPGGGGEQPALASHRPRGDGAAGRVLRAAAAVRLRRGAGALDPDRRGDLPLRPGAVRRAGVRARAAPGIHPDARGARRPAARPLGA